MKTIKITLKGGMITSVNGIPKDVSIIVIDFDTESTEKDRITQIDGQDCVISHYDAADNVREEDSDGELG